jgi:hypothetical protein
MVARLAEKLALADAAGRERSLVVELMLAPLDRVSVEATGRAAAERKISGPLIGLVAELVQEMSLAAIALALGQVTAAQVREPVRCRGAAAVAQIASVIALSHQVLGSVRVATLLVAVGLTEAPLDQQVTAEVRAWEVVDSAAVVAEEEADVLAVAHVVAVADVGDDKTVEEEK